MLLKSLKLKNIRSYTEQEINFIEGTTLLAGDIGSGKSTILLALEFALFGILRGDLSGVALLRNGEQKGSVELCFEINGNEIVIGRNLKRTKTSVEQDTGFIIINDVQRDLTPVELKAEVLELLGYPSDLVSKSKSLVFRYTVYTPQEDMKKIILDDTESRLDILRKVFDIDKYKRIKENTQSYIRRIRFIKKEYAGMISDLEEKKKIRTEQQEEFNSTEEKIKEFSPKVRESKAKTLQKKDEIQEVEVKIKTLNELKKDLDVVKAKNRLKQQQKDLLKSEIEAREKQVVLLKKELKQAQVLDFSDEIEKNTEKQGVIEHELKEFHAKISELTATKRVNEETKEKILTLDRCPICLQQVSSDHKERISQKENSKINSLLEHIGNCKIELSKREDELNKVKEVLFTLRNSEKEAAVFKIKIKNLEEKEKRLEENKKLFLDVEKELKELSFNQKEFSQEMIKYTEIENDFISKRKELDLLIQKEQDVVVKYNKFAVTKKNLGEMITRLESEIRKKESVRKKLLRLNDLHHWLEEYFSNLINVIEKQVMMRVYHEFNALFQNWFDVLVENDTIQSRLDDMFTPIVQQNGYDIAIANLSGGERTACALAYRLALNKVINDLITSIQTKELLILDEPTDGFSSEQLDKIRDVLEQLNMKQVIIVSHESKVESFVDNILRVSKVEHVSSVSR